ncbi:MAG TPA: GntR family transcriptional regulator [Terriglobia bacterium]|nr:GntR family transcriptional regulator [Terriglobia bacterium]
MVKRTSQSRNGNAGRPLKSAGKRNRSKLTAAELVYQELKSRILTVRFPPGSVLEEEGVLGKLGFSRTPFREACMRLKEEGWLVAMSRRGYLIAPITFKDTVDVYEMRFILECATAQIAAAHAGRSDVERLEKIVGAEEKHHEKKVIMPSLVRMNFDFHMSLAMITDNVRITAAVRNLLEHVLRFDSMLFQFSPQTSWVGHSAIVAAIKRRNSAEAQKRMHEHIQHARERIFSVFSSTRWHHGADGQILVDFSRARTPR